MINFNKKENENTFSQFNRRQSNSDKYNRKRKLIFNTGTFLPYFIL